MILRVYIIFRAQGGAQHRRGGRSKCRSRKRSAVQFFTKLHPIAMRFLMLLVSIPITHAQLFLAINRSHPELTEGTSVSCRTPEATPADNDAAATQCRSHCLQTALSPLECQFMWVYDVDHPGSAKGRCCPKTAFDSQAGWWTDSWTQDRGTFYRILGVDDNNEWPSVRMDTAGPACVSLGGSTKVCGSGSGSVMAIQPDAAGGGAQGAVDLGALLSRVMSLERLLENTTRAIAALQATTRLTPVNLLSNGGFQSDTTGWDNYGTTDATSIVVTDWEFPGDKAIQVIQTRSTAGPEVRNVRVVPGAQMTLSVFFNLVSIEGGTGRNRESHPLYARIFKWSSRSYINEIGIGDVHVGQGWTYAEKVFTVPSDTTALGIGLYTRAHGLGDGYGGACPSGGCTITVQWDKISLVQHAPTHHECGSVEDCTRNEGE